MSNRTVMYLVLCSRANKLIIVVYICSRQCFFLFIRNKYICCFLCNRFFIWTTFLTLHVQTVSIQDRLFYRNLVSPLRAGKIGKHKESCAGRYNIYELNIERDGQSSSSHSILFVPKRYFNEDGQSSVRILNCLYQNAELFEYRLPKQFKRGDQNIVKTSAALGTPFTHCIPNRLCFICDQIVVIILIISLYKRMSYLGNRFESDLNRNHVRKICFEYKRFETIILVRLGSGTFGEQFLSRKEQE